MDALKTYLLEIFTTEFYLDEALAEFLLVLISIFIWVVLAIVLNLFANRTIHAYFVKRKGDARGKTLGRLLSGTVKVLIIFITALAIISELGFEITPILAGAGILGLAIGFGSQHLVSDLVAGFFIIVDNSFNLNETVEIDGYRGKVTSMNLRVTHISNFLGSELIINNGSIKKIINWSRNNTTAVVDFGVAYETDLSKLTNIMPKFLEALKERYEEIVELPTFLGVTDLADSSINLRIIAKTTTGNHFGIERKIRQDLVSYLNENKVEIPFPQIVVSNKQSN